MVINPDTDGVLFMSVVKKINQVTLYTHVKPSNPAERFTVGVDAYGNVSSIQGSMYRAAHSGGHA